MKFGYIYITITCNIALYYDEWETLWQNDESMSLGCLLLLFEDRGFGGRILENLPLV